MNCEGVPVPIRPGFIKKEGLESNPVGGGQWFKTNHLLLNVEKTKELVVDILQEKEDTCGAHHHCWPGGGSSSGLLQEPGSSLEQQAGLEGQQ